MLQSLTPITNSIHRFPTKPFPSSSSSVQITIPELTQHQSFLVGLKLVKPERTNNIVRAKDKCFNVQVEAEEEDDGEECLNRFDRDVARMGLWREWRRRRFHENAREKRMRKQREANLLRRRRYKSKRDSLSPTENAETKDDFWASDESFEALINDEEVSDEEIESRLKDYSEGTWQYLDGISHS